MPVRAGSEKVKSPNVEAGSAWRDNPLDVRADDVKTVGRGLPLFGGPRFFSFRKTGIVITEEAIRKNSQYSPAQAGTSFPCPALSERGQVC